MSGQVKQDVKPKNNLWRDGESFLRLLPLRHLLLVDDLLDEVLGIE